jgi:hypothetical protein
MMDEMRNTFLNELLQEPPEHLASVWILDRIPHPFEGDAKKFALWRIELSKLIEVDASELVIIGSGAFGISLNPNKNFRAFDEKSDIDVAIVSEYFFNTAWRHLRNMGSDIHSLPPAAKQSVHDHVTKYIYWGTVATDKILPYLPFGKKWGRALDRMAKHEVTYGRTIKARIYKDFDSLRAYQVNNLKGLRTKELAKGLEDV